MGKSDSARKSGVPASPAGPMAGEQSQKLGDGKSAAPKIRVGAVEILSPLSGDWVTLPFDVRGTLDVVGTASTVTLTLQANNTYGPFTVNASGGTWQYTVAADAIEEEDGYSISVVQTSSPVTSDTVTSVNVMPGGGRLAKRLERRPDLLFDRAPEIADDPATNPNFKVVRVRGSYRVDGKAFIFGLLESLSLPEENPNKRRVEFDTLNAGERFELIFSRVPFRDERPQPSGFEFEYILRVFLIRRGGRPVVSATWALPPKPDSDRSKAASHGRVRP
jgi:hypothetical protein